MTIQGPSLMEWRTDYSISIHDRWYPYRSFFQEHGYILWVKSSYYVNGIIPGLEPPNDHPRAPDGFSYTCEANLDQVVGYTPARMTQFPARTTDDRDVVIIVISDGEDGKDGVDVLKHVATGPLTRVDRNHALPVLDILEHGRYVFAVFPMVGSPFQFPWFLSMTEALYGMCQVVEGVAFLHDHLIAHRDLFTDNFLHSAPQRGRWPTDVICLPRYYIIDFVTAVRFSSDSDPSTRTVRGIPWPNAAGYSRKMPHEMLTDKPYCPFKADIWQLGSTFLTIFQQLQNFPEILDVLDSMAADDPDARPTARAAFQSLLDARRSISAHIMMEPLPRPVYVFSDSPKPEGDPREGDTDVDYVSEEEVG